MGAEEEEEEKKKEGSLYKTGPPRHVQVMSSHFRAPDHLALGVGKMQNAYKSAITSPDWPILRPARLQLKFVKPHLEHVLKIAWSGNCCSSDVAGTNRSLAEDFIIRAVVITARKMKGQ